MLHQSVVDKNVSVAQPVDINKLIRAVTELAKQVGVGEGITKITRDVARPECLLVYTRSSQTIKYQLRDKFFATQLNASVENLPGYFAFYVSIDSLLSNPTVQQALTQLLPLFRFEHIRGLTEAITLFVDDEAVGTAILCQSDSGNISIARLDVAERFQRCGYGAKILDHIVDVCIQRGANLDIVVDAARSDNDDPFIFYSKFFKSKDISVKKSRNHAAMFFGGQCSLAISLQSMMTAKYGQDFVESQLSVFQYLAMKQFGLPHEQVTRAPIRRIHYLALGCGIELKDLFVASAAHLEVLVQCGVPSIDYIKYFSTQQLEVLRHVRLEYFNDPRLYAIISKLPLPPYKPDYWDRYCEVIAKMSLEQMEGGLAASVFYGMQKLSYLQTQVLPHLKVNDLLREETYKVLLVQDERVIRQWLDQHTIFDEYTLDVFLDQLAKINPESDVRFLFRR